MYSKENDENVAARTKKLRDLIEKLRKCTTKDELFRKQEEDELFNTLGYIFGDGSREADIARENALADSKVTLTRFYNPNNENLCYIEYKRVSYDMFRYSFFLRLTQVKQLLPATRQQKKNI